MNPKIIHRSTSIARKEYDDDGWDFINDMELDDKFPRPLPFAERRMLATYRMRLKKGSKIMKGEVYERQFNTYENIPYVWRTKKVFYDFLCKYDLFPEL